MAAEDEGVGVGHRYAQLGRDEIPEARRIEHAGHAQDPFTWKARRCQGNVAHRVEGVGDDDQDRIRGLGGSLLNHRPNDPGVLGQEVVAAHPGLAGKARGHDDDVRTGRVGIVVGPDDPRIVADDRGGLGQVEGLALGQAFDDIDQDDVGQTGLSDSLRGRGADVAGSDDGHLMAAHPLVLLVCQSTRGPAPRTRSDTPSANASKLAANIRASFTAA